MKTMTTGLFVGDIDPVTKQKIENAYLRAKPRVIEAMRHHYGTDVMAEGGGCLYWAIYGSEELDKEGIKTMLQAGTMLWAIVTKDQIKTVAKTQMFNFGYQFTLDNPFSVARVEEGGMPEMHVWLAIPSLGCILDFSAGGIKAHFDCHTQGQIGKWMTPVPPPYLVVQEGDYGKRRPDFDGHRFEYEVEPVAIMMAIKGARDLFSREGCKPSCMDMTGAPPEIEKYISEAVPRFLHVCRQNIKERDEERANGRAKEYSDQVFVTVRE